MSLPQNLDMKPTDTHKLKKVFYPGAMVSFRSARKVSSYLVRAKLYPLERTVGSFKCKKYGCQVCLSVNETDIFTSIVTKKTYNISHKFDCSDKLFILTCRKCLIQYVGKTVDECRYRWNNYKSNSRNYNCNQPCMQRHLYEHYSGVGDCGFLEHVSITLIDKTNPSDPLRREDFWRRLFCTMAPYGLNIDETMYDQFHLNFKKFHKSLGLLFCGGSLPHYVFMRKNI